LEQLKPFSPISNQISVSAAIGATGNHLTLQFQLSDPQKLVLDSLRPGAWASWERADELWKTTCLEAFFALPNGKAYLELNLSPAQMKWNLYFFDDYRLPQPPRRSEDFSVYSIQATTNSLTCQLASKNKIPKLLVSLCAVIRTETGPQYHALAHAADKPDFHDRRSFILSI
jgi:hypothetical protein